jgi:hypothetical protein
MAQDLAERLWWQAARRDPSRVARHLSYQKGADGIYQLDESAWLNDFSYVLQELGVGDWLGNVKDMAFQREIVPGVQMAGSIA